MIYLDHAATSWPKPPGVPAAIQRWFDELGVSASRGDGARCEHVSAVVHDTRRRLANLCDVPPDRVAFTSGATESLNLLLRGMLGRGDSVLTTALEHSSVVRPLQQLRGELELSVDVLPVDRVGILDVRAVERALEQGGYRAMVFTHASNVTGSAIDATRICTAARRAGCLTLVDASQTAGLLPLDVGADALAASAHKSLLGPPGLGFLAVRSSVELRPVKQGGTGSAAALELHPAQWPERMEAGTPNTPAIFGLHAALDWRDTRDPLSHGLALLDFLRGRLAARPGARVLGPADGPRVPVLSFVLEDLDCAEAGVILAEAGIHVRTGFHCAPWIHRHLGTESSGTIRISPGPFNTEDDVLAVVDALAI
jgi:selenocysteine lyase/cysteine desulfurase